MKFHGLSKLVEDPASFRSQPPSRPEVWHMPPSPLTALLTLKDMDRILGDGLSFSGKLRIYRKGEKVNPINYTWGGKPIDVGFEEYTRAAAVSSMLGDGCTFVLNGIRRIWQPVGDMCRRLSLEVGLPIDAIAFLTPPGNSGLNYHWDDSSAVLVQTAGSKTWRLYDPILTDPVTTAQWPNIRKMFWPNQEEIVKSPPAFEVTLQPGDVLWIPRGWIHRGFTTDELSLHVSFAFPPFTRYWLATQVVSTLVERAEMRKELPWGVAQDVGRLEETVSNLIQDLIDVVPKIDRSSVAHRIAKDMRKDFLEPTRNPVTSVLVNDITSTTPIVMIPESIRGIDRLPDGRLCLDLRDTTVTLDECMSNVIRERLELDSRQSWCAQDLIPELDEAAAVKAVANLLRAGVVRRCDSDEWTNAV